MIIDCHTHLGRNEHIKASVKQLLDSMDKAGIDKSLVFASELADYPTYEMLKEIEPHRDRLFGVASWNFRYTQALSGNYGTWALGNHQRDILSKLYKAGHIVAVKFYTGYDHYMPGSDQVRYALDEFNRVGCPVIFHSGDCLNSAKCAKLKYAHPLHIDEIAVDYPNINIVIAHMGFPWHRDAAQVCYKNANVYADISGFVYGDFSGVALHKFSEVLQEFLDIAPPEKLLFGTDFPISNQKSYLNAAGMTLSPQALSENVKKAFEL